MVHALDPYYAALDPEASHSMSMDPLESSRYQIHPKLPPYFFPFFGGEDSNL